MPPPPPPCGGAMIVGVLYASSDEMNSSCASCTFTLAAWTGRTQANSAGLPVYVNWSHRMERCDEMEKTIRCALTTVTSVGGRKQPPHAWAWVSERGTAMSARA